MLNHEIEVTATATRHELDTFVGYPNQTWAFEDSQRLVLSPDAYGSGPLVEIEQFEDDRSFCLGR